MFWISKFFRFHNACSLYYIISSGAWTAGPTWTHTFLHWCIGFSTLSGNFCKKKKNNQIFNLDKDSPPNTSNHIMWPSSKDKAFIFGILELQVSLCSFYGWVSWTAERYTCSKTDCLLSEHLAHQKLFCWCYSFTIYSAGEYILQESWVLYVLR